MFATNKKSRSVYYLRISSLICFILAGLLLLFSSPVEANNYQFQGTVLMPTVTGTPTGVIATVRYDQEQIKVRTGPSTRYPQIGVLVSGQSVPVKGRSPGGDWLQIEYLGVPDSIGWVYAPLVSITAGELPIVEPPPQPTPLYTTTIDPTLAAQFITTPIPTRMPTFTQAPAIVIPTFTDTISSSPTAIPMGLIIIIVAGLGILLAIFAIIQGR
jgi:uncharacterized protein YraI